MCGYLVMSAAPEGMSFHIPEVLMAYASMSCRFVHLLGLLSGQSWAQLLPEPQWFELIVSNLNSILHEGPFALTNVAMSVSLAHCRTLSHDTWH